MLTPLTDSLKSLTVAQRHRQVIDLVQNHGCDLASLGYSFRHDTDTVAAPMSLETLLSEYGYYAIAIGTFFEGETILVLGGFAAHRGYLELPWVITCAFFGTLAGDQLYFYIGRSKGKHFLQSRPNWKARSEKVFSLLKNHQLLLILGFRFLYGLRTVTPFIIGASGISPARFLLLNIIGAAIWALVVGVAGYLFGHSLEIIIADIKHYELAAFASLLVIGISIWLVHFLRKRSAAKRGIDQL